jgi:penicillin-binding protein activator
MIKIIAVVIVCLLCSSCATTTAPVKSYSTSISPDEDDRLGGTGIESTDIRTAARKMAESMLEVPEIAQADGIPRITLLPVKNNTRFVINQDIFTKKIRIELNQNSQGKMRFLARDRMIDIEKERAEKRDGTFTTSKTADMLGVDFFLTGELNALSKASEGSRSDYILMSFQLIDAETSDIIWEDGYEVKRVGTAGVAYQ